MPGLNNFRSLSVVATAQTVKDTAGRLVGFHVINLGTAPRFLKLYDALAPTVGTTAPKLTLAIPSPGDANGGGFTLALPDGVQFDTAITVAATTGIADASTDAPSANEVVVNLFYK